MSKRTSRTRLYFYTVARMVLLSLGLAACACVLWFVAFMSWQESGSSLYLPLLVIIPIALAFFLLALWGGTFALQVAALKRLRSINRALRCQRPHEAMDDMKQVLKTPQRELNKAINKQVLNSLSWLLRITNAEGKQFQEAYCQLMRQEAELEKEVGPLSASRSEKDKAKAQELSQELQQVRVKRDQLVDQLPDVCSLN